MGAGDGELTLAAARLVGTAGRVYSSELGDGRVKALREKLARPARPIAGKDGMHGITAETLSRELKDAGFEAVSSIGIQRAIMVVVAKAKQ
jgi:tRNA A58 N-methylase Trm61